MRQREQLIIAALLGVGLAGFAAAWLVFSERSKQLAERPEGSGDVGSITVYAQRPEGPFRLQPGRPRELKRPQDLSFQWTVNGTGPRELRVEITSGNKTTVMHEERLTAPADQFPLEYVLHVDERLPDRLELAVILEAPHTAGYESRYPLVITGTDKWTLDTSTTAER